MSKNEKNAPEESKEKTTPETKSETTKPETKPEPEKSTFFSLLKDGKIKVGDKVGFTPKDSDKEKIITVDKNFLELKLKTEKFYEDFKYNLK